MADNIDHDTRTIDGKGTFHDMGMIDAFTPGDKSVKSIIRSNATIADVRANGRINILPYSKELIANRLCYEKLPEFVYEADYLNTELLLKITWALRTSRPSWSGIMQAINHGSHPGKSVSGFFSCFRDHEILCLF